MLTTTPGTTVPESLPILSRGKHRRTGHGACFMEYTSLLAGEPFSDSPRCVDRELAIVLRRANDSMTDAERGALVPLLGRAIGLVAPSPHSERPPGWHPFRIRLRYTEQDRDAVAVTRQLHRSVAERLIAAVGPSPSAGARLPHERHPRVSELFIELMDQPTTVGHDGEFTGRLVERLALLHQCYEEAMDELGLRSRTTPERTPSVTASCVPAS
jgi:hypothetical protein